MTTLTLSMSANANPNYPPSVSKKLKKNEVVHINWNISIQSVTVDIW